MDLTLDLSVTQGLVSKSAISGRLTEHWASQNLYCLSCPSDHLEQHKPGTPVKDFTCPSCYSTYQLKGKNGKHGKTVPNSAYQVKMAAISEGKAPNYAFLDYDLQLLRVTGLFIVPSHFIGRSLVRPRKPLSPSARRAGWVGSTILLDRLPQEGRIPLIQGSQPIDRLEARNVWRQFQFLKDDTRALGGWGGEILAAVREIQTTSQNNRFTLRQFYNMFLTSLRHAHPENHNVEAKIRQQLQVLRDHGVLRFVGRGEYQILH
ncbi:MAG: restriction endonuclease [Chloroflexota bacterium]|nr:restriction endonuclease [Chloroflexota bacterium]